MPIYEYSCEQCGNQFEELVFGEDEKATCPGCGREECKRMLSVSWGSASSKGGTGMPRGQAQAGGCGSGGFT